MKSKPLEISIVGAGIGGLVAALALKKKRAQNNNL